MATFSDLEHLLEPTPSGWTLASADKIWLVMSVDTWDDAETRGESIFLGQHQNQRCWYYELDEKMHAFDNQPEAKGLIASIASEIPFKLFHVSLGDYLRHDRAVIDKLELPDILSELRHHSGREYYRYKYNRGLWTHGGKHRRDV